MSEREPVECRVTPDVENGYWGEGEYLVEDPAPVAVPTEWLRVVQSLRAASEGSDS